MHPRPVAEHGCKRKAERRQRQEEQRQRGRGVARGAAQPDEEPGLFDEPAQQRQHGQAGRRKDGEALEDVTMTKVAEFVCEHGLDFIGVEFVEQGVEEDDALGRTKAGEVGIAVGRAARAIHHEQTLGLEAAACQQAFDPRFQGFIGKRGEAVEERCDEGWPDQHHEQVEGKPESPHPQPPQAAHGRGQPQQHAQQRQTDDDGQGGLACGVGGEQGRGHAIEAEALLDDKGAYEHEGQVEQPAQYAQ